MLDDITEDERDLHETLAAFAPVFISLLAQAGFFRGQPLTKRFWNNVTRAALAKNTEAWQQVAKLYGIPSFREGQLQTVNDLGIKPTAILPKGEPKAVLKAANPSAREFFERREKKFIALTTRDDMKRCRALTEAEAKKVYQEVGNNPVMHERKFAKKFENSYICDGDQTRLKRIKRTESHNAATAGAYLQAEHVDAKGSWWRTAGDRRVRDAHAAVNGTWAALGHTFANGKIGPVGEINCRCHQEFTFDVPKGYTAKEPIKGAMWNEDNWEQSKWQPPKESTRALFRPKAKAEKPVTVITKVSKAPAEAMPKKAPEVKKPIETQKPKAPIEKPKIPTAPVETRLTKPIEKLMVHQKPIDLTYAEQVALKDYAEEGYANINGYLRGKYADAVYENESFLINAKRNIAAIDSAMEKSVLEEQTVYRFLRHPDWYNNLNGLEGTVIEDKAFVSTSKYLNKQIVMGGESRIIMEISIPKGSKGIDIIDNGIKNTKLHREEAEVLLNRGSRFKVLGATMDDKGMAHIKAELIQ